MKSLNLAVIVSSVLLLVSGAVLANDTGSKNVHHNFSKRPYHQPLPDSAYQKGNEFEGATLVRDEVSVDEKKASEQQHVMRMNALSKRPY